jgi:hypothetical protein
MPARCPLDARSMPARCPLDARLQLDPARVKDMAKERKYDHVFYATLGQIERNAEKGTCTPQPDDYLTTGRVVRESPLRTGRAIDPNWAFSTPMPKCREEPQQAAGMQALERSSQQLGTAMAPNGRTQDVRSEAEKEPERQW